MSKERIFIVEDDDTAAEDLRRRLESFGYEVCGRAANDAEARKEIPKLDPDLIMMDIMLPGSMDGIDLAIKLRWELNLPSIFVTAYADQEVMARARAADPLGYVLKPVNDRELSAILEAAFVRTFSEKSLRKSEEIVSAILNSTTDAIIVVNGEGKTVFINPEAEALLGISDRDAQGKEAPELFTLTEIESGRPFRLPAALPANSPVRAEKLRLLNRVGRSYIVEMTLGGDGSGRAQRVISFRDVSRLHEVTDTLRFTTTHDQLTGLLNRNEFSARMHRALKAGEQERRNHWVMFVDIDHFRVINDACGTEAGDALLKRTARRFESRCGPDSVSSRLGGDDFVVLFQGDPEETAAGLAEEIRRDPFVWMGKQYPITVSIGIVPLSRGFRNEHELMLAGNQLVHSVHGSGGNRHEFLSEADGADRSAVSTSDWISLLHEAAQKDLFRLYYQPIEPLSERASDAKAEILLRLAAPDGTIIPPGEFIGIAERYGIMPSIDRWVIDRAFAAWKRLVDRESPLSQRVFSVNLSGMSLADEGIISFIIEKAEEHLIDPARFCLEITETSAIHNLTSASRLIYVLKDRGFRFALDDFGSGFSSFNYLKNLPVDYLKIDGSFIRNMDRDRVDYTMVEAMSSMGRVLGLQTIGEYARNDKIIEMLRDIGVDFAQGYGISEPKPLE